MPRLLTRVTGLMPQEPEPGSAGDANVTRRAFRGGDPKGNIVADAQITSGLPATRTSNMQSARKSKMQSD